MLLSMTNWEPGISALNLKRTKSYYECKNMLRLNKLVMKLVQESKTWLQQVFEAGETDYAPINSDLVDKYKDDEAFKQVS